MGCCGAGVGDPSTGVRCCGAGVAGRGGCAGAGRATDGGCGAAGCATDGGCGAAGCATVGGCGAAGRGAGVLLGGLDGGVCATTRPVTATTQAMANRPRPNPSDITREVRPAAGTASTTVTRWAPRHRPIRTRLSVCILLSWSRMSHAQHSRRCNTRAHHRSLCCPDSSRLRHVCTHTTNWLRQSTKQLKSEYERVSSSPPWLRGRIGAPTR